MVMEKGGWSLGQVGIPLVTYPLWVAGRYYSSPATHTLSTSNTAERLFTFPIYVPGVNGCAIDELGLEITTGGTAGGLARVGLYADKEGIPWDLLLDAGTIPIDGVGWQHVDVALRLRGWVWVAIAIGKYASKPTYRASNGQVTLLGYNGTIDVRNVIGYTCTCENGNIQVGLYARFPTNHEHTVLPGLYGVFPRLMVRAA